MQKNIKAVNLFIFILGALFYFYDFVLQVSPGVMAASLVETFKISAAILGSISGIYFYSYTLLQIPAGLLLDRFGVNKVLPLVILACSLGALVFSTANHFVWIGVGRFLMGGGSAFAFLGALYITARWLPVKYFALFAGLIQMIGSLGAIGGETPFAYLIEKIGWRETMLFFAIAGLLLAGLVKIFIRETSQMEKFAKKHTEGKIWVNFKSVIRSKQTWMIGIYSFAIWAPIASFAGLWGIAFLKLNCHLTNLQAANKLTLVWLAIAVSCPLIGWVSELIKKRVLLLALTGVIGLFSTLTLIYLPYKNELLICIELFCLGIAASGQSLAFAVINDIQPRHLAGAANGFNNMMIVLGGAIFQPLIGFLLDFHNLSTTGQHVYTLENYRLALFVLPFLYFIAAITAGLFIKESYKK